MTPFRCIAAAVWRAHDWVVDKGGYLAVLWALAAAMVLALLGLIWGIVQSSWRYVTAGEGQGPVLIERPVLGDGEILAEDADYVPEKEGTAEPEAEQGATEGTFTDMAARFRTAQRMPHDWLLEGSPIPNPSDAEPPASSEPRAMEEERPGRIEANILIARLRRAKDLFRAVVDD